VTADSRAAAARGGDDDGLIHPLRGWDHTPANVALLIRGSLAVQEQLVAAINDRRGIEMSLVGATSLWVTLSRLGALALEHPVLGIVAPPVRAGVADLRQARDNVVAAVQGGRVTLAPEVRELMHALEAHIDRLIDVCA